MSVPGFSITELAQAARKLKDICNAFFNEFENAPARISELVETCNYLSTVLEEFGALLGDSYPQETTFKRKLDECYTFITKYSALNRQQQNEAAQEDRIAGKLRNTGAYAWQTTRFSFDDKRAQTLKDGLSLEIQKFLTFILLFALRRTVPVGDASSSTLNSQRPTIARQQDQERLTRPSRFALAATGQTSTNFMIEDEGDTIEICFRRLLRLRSLYERETSMAAVNGQPDNIALEPLQQTLESIWHTLCVRAGVARLDGPAPPLPREPLRLLEAPAQNYNALLIDMTPSSMRARRDSHAGLFSPTIAANRPAIHRRPVPASSPPQTSRSSSYFNSPDIGRGSAFNSPQMGRHSMSSTSTMFTTESSPYHAGSVSSFGATPFALPLPAMSSHSATITISHGTGDRKRNVEQRTLLLQEWRCRPEFGRAQLIEWTGEDPAQIFHHHIPEDAIPQTFHTSQKLRKFELTFEYGHSHHIMLFENDRIADEQQMPVEYLFTSTETRDMFQGDILGKVHAASFDMNVIWSDSIHETNAMGNVEGMAILERIHIWKDKQWPHRHTISFLASKSSGTLEEYPVACFKQAERSHGTVTLKRKEREHRDSSASNTSRRRRSSILRRFSVMSAISDEAITSSPVSPMGSTTIEMEGYCLKWLSIKFTGKSPEAKLFLQTFNTALEQDGQPADIPYPSVVELADTPAPAELPAEREPSELDGVPFRLHA